MQLHNPLKRFAFCLLLIAPVHGLFAQGCTNSIKNPNGFTTPDTLGNVKVISNCSYTNEYSAVGPSIAGRSYRFTLSGSSAYITVHEGTSDGPIIAYGPSPVTATATVSDFLFAHWTWDSECTFVVGCKTSKVKLLLDCTPPAATVTVEDSCSINAFFLSVNISDYGDGTGSDIIHTVDNGTPDTLFAAPLGVSLIGPFPAGQSVDVTVTHSSNPLCNAQFNENHSNECPEPISCGEPTLVDSYCFGLHDYHEWRWQNTDPGGTVALLFNSGTLYAPGSTQLTIYDGNDNTGAILFQNQVAMDLSDTLIQTTGPNMYMELDALPNYFGSCQDGLYVPWNWTVGCLDCIPATAKYEVVTDCNAQTFQVDVHLTDLGSQALVQLTNDAGAPMLTATTPGTYTVGPFPNDAPVIISIPNNINSLCSTHSPVLTNPLCPTYIPCGAPPVDMAYCYHNFDEHSWHWQSSDEMSSLSIAFSAGTIQSAIWDSLFIYNAADDSDPSTLLYMHTMISQEDLAGLQFTAGSGHIFMKVISDWIGSCDQGSETEWAWQVACLDCIQPQADFTVNTDCDAQQFTVDVHVGVLGTDSTLDITNDYDPLMVTTATDTGVYTIGPFPITTEVVFTLVNDFNSLCNLVSDVVTNPLCPSFINCGEPALNLSYCYGNYDLHTWHWQNTIPTGSLTVNFLSGTIGAPGTFGDNLKIYDGVDNTAPLLAQNSSPLNLAGVTVQSTGPDMYMELNSLNSQVLSCADGQNAPWDWTVGCNDCAPATATFAVLLECDSNRYYVDVDITAMGSAPVLEIINDNGAPPVNANSTGTYSVGPFDNGTNTVVTVQNNLNHVCNLQSAVLTDALCPDTLECEDAPVTETYCYTNHDDHTWHWYCACGNNLLLDFSAGTIESYSYDPFWIYDGPDNNAPVLYHNFGGTDDIDLSTLSFLSTGSDLYMEMSSDYVASCEDGLQDEWVWTVGCDGTTVVNEGGAVDFVMYPNPATNELYLRLPGDTNGTTEIKILDAAGRIVLLDKFTAKGANLNTFDLHGLQNGTYSVIVTASNWVKAQRLQVIH